MSTDDLTQKPRRKGIPLKGYTPTPKRVPELTPKGGYISINSLIKQIGYPLILIRSSGATNAIIYFSLENEDMEIKIGNKRTNTHATGTLITDDLEDILKLSEKLINEYSRDTTLN